ncbi:TPA_asm: hypothetical protein [Pseudomonas phage vB_PaeS-D14O]|nr:TPA_asm: hypothetical protein [Pseudomonas phage vB_PaeS-D14O]
MSDVMIKPVRSYLDGGRVRKAGGDAYLASEHLARQLVARGLCQIVESEIPKPVAGESLSASQVAPASQQKTANESESGGTPRRRGRPSVRTQRSD